MTAISIGVEMLRAGKTIRSPQSKVNHFRRGLAGDAVRLHVSERDDRGWVALWLE